MAYGLEFKPFCGYRFDRPSPRERRRFVSEILVPYLLANGEACVPYLKPIVAGLIASVVTYFCFLAWLHWKTVSFVKEQGDTGLVAVAGDRLTYCIRRPSGR